MSQASGIEPRDALQIARKHGIIRHQPKAPGRGCHRPRHGTEGVASMQEQTTAVWRLIPSHLDYEASSDGCIRRRTPGQGTWPGRELRMPIDSQGYPTVNIDKRPYRVHVLVAEAFLGPIPPGGQVHHRNEDKIDARVENLKVTPSRLAHAEHHRRPGSRRRRHGDSNPLLVCACGCGEKFPKFDSCGRPREFVAGHNLDRDGRGRYASRRVERG